MLGCDSRGRHRAPLSFDAVPVESGPVLVPVPLTEPTSEQNPQWSPFNLTEFPQTCLHPRPRDRFIYIRATSPRSRPGPRSSHQLVSIHH